MRFSFPLAGRELTRSGRMPRTYVVRFGVAMSGFMAVVLTWGELTGFAAVTPDTLDPLGTALVEIVLWFQCAVAVASVPFLTAGLIAEEREEQQLHLLLIADLTPLDIYIAKFSAVFLQVALLLASTFPLVATAAFFGGVDVPRILLRTALIGSAGLAFCSLGVLCSALVSGVRQAFMLAVAAIGLWFFWTAAFDLWLQVERPLGFAFRTNLFIALVEFDSRAPGTWVPSLLAHALLGTASMIATLVVFPRLIYGKRKQPYGRGRVRNPWGKGILRMSRLSQFLAANAGGSEFTQQSLTIRAVAVFVLWSLALVPVVGWACIPLALALHISAAMRSASRNGTLADVLQTPLAERDLAWTVFLSNVSRSLVFLPLLMVAECTLFAAFVRLEEAHPLEQVAGYIVLPFLIAAGRYLCLVIWGGYAGIRARSASAHCFVALLVTGGVAFVAYSPGILNGITHMFEFDRPAYYAAGLGGIFVFIPLIWVVFRWFSEGLWDRPLRFLPARRTG